MGIFSSLEFPFWFISSKWQTCAWHWKMMKKMCTLLDWQSRLCLFSKRLISLLLVVITDKFFLTAKNLGSSTSPTLLFVQLRTETIVGKSYAYRVMDQINYPHLGHYQIRQTAFLLAPSAIESKTWHQRKYQKVLHDNFIQSCDDFRQYFSLSCHFYCNQ